MSWILTASGRRFDYLDPRPHDIHIVDIAQALANESRFAGHIRGFYSVAQHSWHVSYLVPRRFALEGLLHDASEAYCKDIPMPLKQLLPDYRAIEDRVETVIRAHFGLPPEKSGEVKHADLVMLATERRDLMPEDTIPWSVLAGIEPSAREIVPMQPPRAMTMFLKRWVELS